MGLAGRSTVAPSVLGGAAESLHPSSNSRVDSISKLPKIALNVFIVKSLLGLFLGGSFYGEGLCLEERDQPLQIL